MSTLVRLLPTIIKVLAGVGAGQILNKVAADANVKRVAESAERQTGLPIVRYLPVIAVLTGFGIVYFAAKKSKI